MLSEALLYFGLFNASVTVSSLGLGLLLKNLEGETEK